MVKGKKMILSTGDLQIGQWIIMHELGTGFYYKGYILKIISLTSISFFCIGYHKGKKFFPVYKSYVQILTNSHTYNLFYYNEVEIEDIEDKKYLIDLALMTNDKNWFNKLIN